MQPCSNCAARSISCNFLVPPHGRDEVISPIQHNSELLERIERLESVILPPVVGSRSYPGFDDVTQQATQLAHSSPVVGEVVTKIHKKRDKDSRLLENVGTREDSLVCD